jgi:hypothetical protein
VRSILSELFLMYSKVLSVHKIHKIGENEGDREEKDWRICTKK